MSIEEQLKETNEYFKRLLLEENMLPSKALKILMDESRLMDRNPSHIIFLLKYVYPEIELNYKAFSSYLVDSFYPFVREPEFTDEMFDEGIKACLEEGLKWYDPEQNKPISH